MFAMAVGLFIFAFLLAIADMFLRLQSKDANFLHIGMLISLIAGFIFTISYMAGV